MSKYLSYLLRHDPKAANLAMDANGWVLVDEIVKNTKSTKKKITHAEIMKAVETDNKQRYSLSEDKTKIRANQGHSIEVDLGLEPVVPPVVLYHGTATKFIQSIFTQGLVKGTRQHVHLSESLEIAEKVGLRHGTLALLEVDTLQMHQDGFVFYQSENGVWLTDHVPAIYLIQIN